MQCPPRSLVPSPAAAPRLPDALARWTAVPCCRPLGDPPRPAPLPPPTQTLAPHPTRRLLRPAPAGPARRLLAPSHTQTSEPRYWAPRSGPPFWPRSQQTVESAARGAGSAIQRPDPEESATQRPNSLAAERPNALILRQPVSPRGEPRPPGSGLSCFPLRPSRARC